MSKVQSLNNRPDYVARLPKTDHVLSHDFSFTASTGHILPIDQQFMNVSERITYTPHIYAQSNPLLSPAMCDVDVYVDTFFVPMQMLFTAWDAVRWQVNDPISSLWAAKFKTSQVDLPLISIDSCIGNGVVGAAITDYWSQYLNRFTGLESFTSLGRLTDFDCVAKEQFRLLNHFRLSTADAFVLSSSTPYYLQKNPNCFYVFLLAYQCIWENHYRLDDWEKKNVSSYNIDNAYLTDGAVITSNPWILRMNYRPWHLDYFTSVKNNPITSFRNMIGQDNATNPISELNKVNSYLSSNSFNQPVMKAENAGSVSNPVQGVTQTGLLGGSGASIASVTTNAIRQMFALEKLMRIIGRTSKDYDSQVLAHFGFKVPHDVKHQISYLGTSKAILHVGPVVSTADTQSSTGGAALGSKSGQGYFVLKGKTIKFTAPTDGVFMSVFSCVPRVRYTDTIDKQNYITSRNSLYIPEFDRLGAEPLWDYECDSEELANPTNRMGWQYRYECFKRRPNIATLAFQIPKQGGSPQVNMYQSFIVSRKVSCQPSNLYRNYYCPPTALNQCMAVTYDTSWSTNYETKPWLIYQQDPFIIDYHSECFLVSPMSRFGEPELD